MANENTIQATGTFITRKGLNLITKLVAAKGTLSFSRAAVGTGKPPEGYSPDSMISLSSYKMDAEIADYGTQEDKAYVTMQVSSDQVEEGFLLTEVGLYATDPDQGEILYAYMDISTDPTYIYANGSANRTKYAEFTLYVLIGTVEKVTAAVTPGSIITKETFKASNLPVIDTHGIMGDSGSTVMSQELFDAVAEKIVNELVSNEKLNTVLTEKLADYIMKSKIVNHLLATDESTVLSGPMGKELKGLLDVLNTNTSKIGHTHDERYYTEEEIENKLYWKAIGEEISLYPESVNTDVYYQNDKLKSAKELLIYHSNFGCIYIPNINQYVVQTQIRSEYFWVTVSVSFQKDEGRIAYKIIAKGSSENFSSNRIVGVAYR